MFTRDINCTIEFDAFGFSVKDFLTRHILLRCDSSSDLYPVTQPSSLPSALMSLSSSTWHQRLGHPGDEVLRSLTSRDFISCNKEKSPHVCHASQLGKHVKLPFSSSTSIVSRCFEIIHLDIWTSLYLVQKSCLASIRFYEPPLVGKRPGLVVKPATIRTVFSLALMKHWPVHQLDVKNAFLNGDDRVYASASRFCGSSISSSCMSPSKKIIFSLHREFDMTDLGALNYFLGISVTRETTGMFLSQKRYAMELLERAHMLNCNPTRTPVDTEFKLGPEGTPISYPTLYQSLVGTLEFGLQLYASSESSLVAFFDVDSAGCPATRRSTSGYYVFMGNNILSWSSKRQHTLSRSSAEAEYRGVANVVAETAWLHNLL
uniref:Ribonuclease H-like domain-containing protein n=1 Tax=Tanacetum cinerariifolium TaxID=118510 RepID=A0A6L2KRI1_TANCI|nr:ribonuclease H-like domain-containing protein [Tanacetum cinerariifolium]